MTSFAAAFALQPPEVMSAIAQLGAVNLADVAGFTAGEGDSLASPGAAATEEWNRFWSAATLEQRCTLALVDACLSSVVPRSRPSSDQCTARQLASLALPPCQTQALASLGNGAFGYSSGRPGEGQIRAGLTTTSPAVDDVHYDSMATDPSCQACSKGMEIALASIVFMLWAQSQASSPAPA